MKFWKYNTKISEYRIKYVYLKINKILLLDRGYIIIEIKNIKDGLKKR